MVVPPSTGRFTPVMYLASSEAKNNAAFEISSAKPNFFMGIMPKKWSL